MRRKIGWAVFWFFAGFWFDIWLEQEMRKDEAHGTWGR